MTFHTGSLCALPCRLGWIKPLPNPSWLDISPPPSPPLHTSQAKDSSLPPSFFFHPSRLQCKPKTQDPAEGKCSLKSSPQTPLRKCRGGERKSLGSQPPAAEGFASRAMAPGYQRLSLTFLQGVGSVFFMLQIICVQADGESPIQFGLGCYGWNESCMLKCVIAKKKKKSQTNFFFFLIRSLNTRPGLH